MNGLDIWPLDGLSSEKINKASDEVRRQSSVGQAGFVMDELGRAERCEGGRRQ